MSAHDAHGIAPESTSDEREDELWTVADVSKFLRVSRSWVYQATASGVFPCIHLGALLRFEPAAVRAWLRGERNGKVVTLPGCRG